MEKGKISKEYHEFVVNFLSRDDVLIRFANYLRLAERDGKIATERIDWNARAGEFLARMRINALSDTPENVADIERATAKINRAQR